MNSKAYLKSRLTKVEWLGDVPEHWGIDRLKWSVGFVQNGVWGDEPSGEDDIICIRVADFNRNTFKVVENPETLRSIPLDQFRSRKLNKGDLLIEKSGGGEKTLVGCVVELTQSIEAVCSNFVAKMPVAKNMFPRYWVYFHAFLYAGRLTFPSIKQTTGIQNIDLSSYLNETACFPPLSEQQAIAAFLDRETGRIEALISQKHRLLELLAEQRTALISRAVTKGLDTIVKMKPSGVEWLGDVPEHWDIKRLKYLSTVNDDSLPETTDPDYELLYVDISSVDPDLGIIRKEQMLFAGAPSRARRIVKEGDTIVSTVRTYLRAISSVIEPENNLIVSTGFAVIRPRKISKDYLSAVVRTQYFIEEVVSRSMGVSYPAINASEIGNIYIPLPPLSEQQSIAACIDCETAKIDALSAKVITVIERLKEYRTSLISAAVTGKIDVREAV